MTLLSQYRDKKDICVLDTAQALMIFRPRFNLRLAFRFGVAAWCNFVETLRS
jgi:hypothetical protein